MKYIFALLTLLPIIGAAQNISVKSFHSVPDDMTARVTAPVTDQNGEKCALIKVKTTQTGFVFEGDMMGIEKTEQKTAEIWVYVSHGAKKLSIAHQQLGRLDNYLYPENIKEAMVYVMELTTANVKMVVEDAVIPTNWLVVTSEPAGADVYINDVHKGTTPFQQEMDAGEYAYRVSTSLYHTEAGKFTINANGERTAINAVLKPNFGFATINTGSISSATVFVDGTPLLEPTPCITQKLKPGVYELEVSKPMYFKATQQIEIIENKTINVTIDLKPTFADLTINSEPESGAEVLLDGQTTGKTTPCTLEKMVHGEHTITLRKEWYQPITERITMQAGVDQNKKITLSPTFGTLQVVAENNAKTYIDNEYKANGKWEGRLIGGYHTVEAKLDKYTPDTKKVNIEVGNTHPLSLYPTPQYGSLKIATTPFDATIKLNGKDYGLSPKNINNLLVGEYTLTLEKQGFGTISRTISISMNQILEIDDTLPNGMFVSIKSMPAGADLIIDGKRLGTAPLNISLSYGKHNIILENNKTIMISRFYTSNYLPLL